jgi:hypothetical protein
MYVGFENDKSSCGRLALMSAGLLPQVILTMPHPSRQGGRNRVGALTAGYQTLARRGNFLAIELRDIRFPDGTGQARIRRAKTDAERQGAFTLPRNGEVAQDLARVRKHHRTSDISRVDGARLNCQCATSRRHRDDLQAVGTVDRYAGQLRREGEKATNMRAERAQRVLWYVARISQSRVHDLNGRTRWWKAPWNLNHCVIK